MISGGTKTSGTCIYATHVFLEGVPYWEMKTCEKCGAVYLIRERLDQVTPPGKIGLPEL